MSGFHSFFEHIWQCQVVNRTAFYHY